MYVCGLRRMNWAVQAVAGLVESPHSPVVCYSPCGMDTCMGSKGLYGGVQVGIQHPVRACVVCVDFLGRVPQKSSHLVC